VEGFAVFEGEFLEVEAEGGLFGEAGFGIGAVGVVAILGEERLDVLVEVHHVRKWLCGRELRQGEEAEEEGGEAGAHVELYDTFEVEEIYLGVNTINYGRGMSIVSEWDFLEMGVVPCDWKGDGENAATNNK